MDYPLERLDPERFQQLCQSLLTQEFSDIQCFPVGQPDGGRDAVGYIPTRDATRFVVYQVKFVRNPQRKDSRTWLSETLEGELPKIKNLIPKGAERYYLLTNVAGTAHFESGSIDSISAQLSEHLGLPSICWWRDDINRRLDNSWALKWIYPELMAGPDFLRLIIESGIREDADRRQSTIRAFLRHQYQLDEEVRFKQVELQNKLLDLFIDVPTTLRTNAGYRKKRRAFHVLSRSVAEELASPDISDEMFEFDGTHRWYAAHDPAVGAASLLLSVPNRSELENVVLEGGPGQGKSTITQYVCQVHRIRLLGETTISEHLPEPHRNTAVRLPIRIDLRDFATWLSRKDPFTSADSSDVPPHWAKSLEAFVAALISHHSGGSAFSVDDLIALARVSSLLVVFDGLDEVADISLRRSVVDEIVKGCERLRENAAGLQVVVTSRPAAFANSPGMPERKYTHLALLSLTPELILRYADKWVAARRLEHKLRAEFNHVLKTKLDQPHLRDLARNPMQLAILLSLLLTRGASLPDKRTALYDAYMDLFFSRESEKSSVVRDHRDLLIEIHRYLGWLLHSESEKGNARASISQERLHKALSEYLIREGYDSAIADKLFAGMVERVVALVSRVQGTFEFEVQPLREYFAACYLFHTAPLSTPGRERSGSRPDRFDAIVRNFYWLNVTRFYAGCYSKGELPSLVERLQELCRERGYRDISDPRVLAATLLSDWVFTQNPRSVHQIVELIVDGVSLRKLTAGVRASKRRAREPMLVLHAKAGREELVSKCYKLLDEIPPWDFATDVVQLIQANSQSPHDHVSKWLEYLEAADSHPKKPNARIAWMEFGSQLGVISTLPLEQLDRLVHNPTVSDSDIRVLLSSKRTDLIETSEATFDRAVNLVLNGLRVVREPGVSRSPLHYLMDALRPFRYARALGEPQPLSLNEIDRRFSKHVQRDNREPLESIPLNFENQKRCLRLWEQARHAGERTAREWASELAPWNVVVECGRELWGERQAFNLIANLAAGIRSNSERGGTALNLFDTGAALCARARYARLRCSDSKYLQRLIESAAPEQLEFALLIVFTWTRFDIAVGNAPLLAEALDSLDAKIWRRLFLDVRYCRHLLSSLAGRASRRSGLITPPQESLPVRVSCLLTLISPNQTLAHQLYRKLLANRWEEDPSILEFAQYDALALGASGSMEWSPNLDVVRKCYARGQVLESSEVRQALSSRTGVDWIPLSTAEEIARDSMSFPGFLVDLAQERIRRDVASNVTPVADIAVRDQWLSS